MSGKKGDQSLNLIFGLFILLIVSLVVLGLFFKFSSKSSETMVNTFDEQISKEAKQKAIDDCKSKCEGITDMISSLNYCKEFKRMDLNGDKQVSNTTKNEYSNLDVCEGKIPCFVLSPCEKDGVVYDGTKCKDVMCSNNRPEYYERLRYDKPEGTCKLGTPENGENQKANWVLAYDYVSPCPTE